MTACKPLGRRLYCDRGSQRANDLDCRKLFIVVHTDEKLTAFRELESAIRAESNSFETLIKRATEVGQYPKRYQIDADQ